MRDHLKHIRALPEPILTDLDRLLVNRYGNHPDAFMITRDILCAIHPQQTYQFQLTADNGPYLISSDRNPEPASMAIGRPKHALLHGKWVDAASQLPSEANILGGMGYLYSEGFADTPIPVIPATGPDLAFYHAQLITNGASLSFATEMFLPVTEMSVGKQYVEHYLAQATLGGGDYIEYHDQPHFWAPQNIQANGHILLGRQIGDAYYFTGFRIPFGSAVYLSPYTLHSDAYLLGEYLVVYGLSKHFSTVLFQDQKNKACRIEFSTALL